MYSYSIANRRHTGKRGGTENKPDPTAARTPLPPSTLRSTATRTMSLLFLRVRLPSGETAKVRIPPSTTHAAFLAQVAEGAALEAPACALSLNRREALRAGPAVPVSELGVSHGDLIYLIQPSDPSAPAPAQPARRPAAPSPASRAATAAMARAGVAAPAALPPTPGAPATAGPIDRLVEMGFDAVAARAALDSCSGRVDEAVALLTVEPMHVDPPAPAPALATTIRPQGAAPQASSLFDARTQALASQPAKAAKGGAAPPQLVPQRLVDSIDETLRSSGAQGGHEAVCVTLHTLLVQSGFRLTSVGGVPASGSLPPSWRSSPGVYILGYGHERQAAGGAGGLLEIKCVPMGPHVMIAAMVQAAREPALLQHTLKPADFVSASGPVASVAALCALPRLTHQLSTQLVQPTLDVLRARVLDPSGPGAACELLDLCPELKFGILAHLDRHALCRLSAACSSMRDLASDDALWAPLYEKAFGSTSDVRDDFARAYRGAHVAAREAERQAQRGRPFRSGPRVDPFGGMPPPDYGPFPGGFPGGGPHGGGMPGFAGQVPGAPMRARRGTSPQPRELSGGVLCWSARLASCRGSGLR